MLKELIAKSDIIHIRGREYRTRFSLNALLCLEMTYKPLSEILAVPYTEWGMEDIVQLVRAALCDMPENRQAVCERCWDAVTPDISELGELIRLEDIPALTLELTDAIIHSLPEPDGSSGEKHEDSDDGLLRAACVDIIGMSEDKFWESNQRELAYRIEKYRKVKGVDEDPEHEPEPEIKMYDDTF